MYAMLLISHFLITHVVQELGETLQLHSYSYQNKFQIGIPFIGSYLWVI